jgi:hypothetical protein
MMDKSEGESIMGHKKSGMQGKKLKVMSLAASALAVAGLAAFGANSAFAGTNGQEIQLCQPQSDYRAVDITGTNQNGETTTKSLTNLTRDCTKVEGFFWKGDVTINWSDPATAGILSPNPQVCNVRENSAQDPWPCFGPNTLF